LKRIISILGFIQSLNSWLFITFLFNGSVEGLYKYTTIISGLTKQEAINEIEAGMILIIVITLLELMFVKFMGWNKSISFRDLFLVGVLINGLLLLSLLVNHQLALSILISYCVLNFGLIITMKILNYKITNRKSNSDSNISVSGGVAMNQNTKVVNKVSVEKNKMSVEKNVNIIQTALSAGENVVITGYVYTGKTYLLEALEEQLKQDRTKTVKYFTGESIPYDHDRAEKQIAKIKTEISEIIRDGEDTILLIDELKRLSDADITLKNIKPSTRIVAAVDVFDLLIEQGLEDYFDKLINLNNGEVVQLKK